MFDSHSDSAPSRESARLTKSTAAAVWTAVLGVLVLLAVIDCLARGWVLVGLSVLFGGAAVCWLSLALFVFPAVYAQAEGLLVRNPLAVVFFPWSSIAEVSGRFFVEIADVSGRVTKVWAAPLSAVRTHKRRLRNKAADADIARSGMDPDEVSDRRAVSAVETIRDAVEDGQAADAGASDRGAEAAEVRRSPNAVPWLVLAGLAVVTGVLTAFA